MVGPQAGRRWWPACWPLVAEPDLFTLLAKLRPANVHAGVDERALWVVRTAPNDLRVRSFSDKPDSDRLGDLIVTLHTIDDPDGPPKIVVVVEIQTVIDRRKLFTWVEYRVSRVRSSRRK